MKWNVKCRGWWFWVTRTSPGWHHLGERHRGHIFVILYLVWLFLGVLPLNTPHLHSPGNTHSHAHWPQVIKSLMTRMIKAGAIQACCFYFHSPYFLTRWNGLGHNTFCTICSMFSFLENIHQRIKDFLQIMGVNCDLSSRCDNHCL